MALPGGTTIHYITDPLNRRIAREINGTIVEKYLWADLTTLLAVYDGNDNLVQRFEYADGRMPVAMTQGGQKYYLHYDQVGSLRAVSDASHNLIKEITYDTYGNILSDTNSSFKTPFGFAGGLYDPDTKLTHFGYREYDAYTGKWTAKDPIGFAGGDSNLYGYVLGDPVGFVDPTGENAAAVIVGGGIIAGGWIATHPHSNIGQAITNWWNGPHWWNNSGNNVCEANPVDKNKKPSHPDYSPHKKRGGLQKIPWNKNRKGWPAKDGTYWEPVPDGHRGTHDPHWDQQFPDGSHIPRYPQE